MATKSESKNAAKSLESRVIDELARSYFMELETVMNYIANSTNLVGVRADAIKKSLLADVMEEVGHAQTLARRIHVLGGSVPGSTHFKAAQMSLQPPSDPCDITSVIRGVIDAEAGAIAQYKKIISLCRDANDPVTEDICITVLADEEEHKREFEGFLAELARR
jgi:bacterioferritin